MKNLARQIATAWTCGLIIWTLHAVSVVSAADGEWTPVTRVMSVYGNYEFTAKWKPKTGIRLRFSDTKSKRHVTCHLHSGGSTVSDWTGDPSSRTYVFVAYNHNLPKMAKPNALITVKIRSDAWWLYVNRQLVAIVKPSLPLPLSLEIDNDHLNSGQRVHFQKVAPFSFSAEFMDDGKSKNVLKDWEKLGGDWNVHTVLQDAIADKTSKNLTEKPLDPEHSPNFFNLRASGKGVMVAGYDFEDDYSIKTSLKTGDGGGGLVFFHLGDRDFYTLTLEPMKENDLVGILKLVRRSSVRIPRTKTLGIAEVPLTANQWISLEARVRGAHLECLLDERTIFDLDEDAHVGGRYGLCIDASEGKSVLFDDFDVHSLSDLSLPNVFWIRFHVMDSENDLFRQASGLLRMFDRTRKNPPAQSWIDSSLSGKPRWLALGSKDHGPHRYAATFTLRSERFDVGVLAGFKDRNDVYYRFRCRFDGDRFVRTLEGMTGGQPRLLAKWDTLSTIGRVGLRHRLEVELTDSGMLKAYHNGALTFVEPVPSTVGGSGLYLGKSTQAKISGMTYSFQPRTRFVNRYEKNPLFVKDRFMKHWSSPEGEWLTDPKKRETWHKSDVFGAYALHLPYVKGSEAHLSVEENRKESPVFLRITAGGTFELRAYGRTVAEGTLPEAAQNDVGLIHGRKVGYVLHCEDHCVWVVCNDEMVLSYRMNHRLKGSRIRLKGFKPNHLVHSKTYREKVADFLFTEAMHDWKRTGGDWKVTNRFICEPQWSHLNGKNPDGVASLWGKQILKGDFCVELFVGLHHGAWYVKPGRDFNVTIMNDGTSTNSGYTVTCSGWDKNESQRWTRLYKNGKIVKQSDAYTAPRIRSGNKRMHYDPIISRGRDVHGAWYYVKFRRKGKRLQYFFDNQLVLEYDDPKPITVGSFGIWTYRNSMMVARVRVTADEISNQWFPIKHLPALPKSKPKSECNGSPLIAGGLPADLMQPSLWKSSLTTSNCVTEWVESGGRNHVVQRNVFGGGSMLLSPDLPALSPDRVAGVRFKVKRTVGTQFNFHYSVKSSKKSTRTVRYVHVISGDHMETAKWRMFGKTPTKGLAKSAFTRGKWTDVTVWFPARLTRSAQVTPTIHIDGFGSLKPSVIQQGLLGNTPGDAFAIANFQLIYRNLPTFAQTGDVFPRHGISGLDEKDVRVDRAQLFEPRLRERQTVGLNRITIKPKKGASFDFSWIHLPEIPDFKVVPDPNVPYAITIENPLHDLRVAATIGWLPVQKKSLVFKEAAGGSLHANYPVDAVPSKVELELRINGKRHTQKVPGGPASYPILVDLQGPIGVLIDPDVPTSLEGVRPLFETPYAIDVKRHLEFRTGTYPDRLNATFPVTFNLATHPLLSFRYACDDAMAVSLVLDDAFAKFSEEIQKKAVPLQYGQVNMDDKWHNWLGRISDIDLERPFSKHALQLRRIRLGSTHQIAQTGSYSSLRLNGVTLGPAVNSHDKLAFKPTYVCPDGIQSVEYATLNGVLSYENRSKSVRDALKWTQVMNGATFTVSEKEFPTALGWVLIRATSLRHVVSDRVEIPFLVDKTSPTSRAEFKVVTTPRSNGTMLVMTVPVNNGAPLDYSNLTFQVQGKPIIIDAHTATIRHSRNSDVLNVNWPYLMHTIGSGGKTVELTIGGIRDGAMNEGKELVVSLPPKDFEDTVGPAWLKLDTTKALAINRGLLFPWTDPSLGKTEFKGGGATNVTLQRAFGKTPYLSIRGYKMQLYAHIGIKKGSWNLDFYPYLSLSFRYPQTLTSGTLNLLVKGREKTVTLPLAKAGPNVPKAGEWHTVTLDVAKAFGDVADTARVWHVAIQGTNVNNEFVMHMRDLVVHRPWSPIDVILPSAYDGSGVTGYRWRYVVDGAVQASGNLPLGPIKPAALVKPGPRPGWLHVYAVDKKKNRSRAIRLPIR